MVSGALAFRAGGGFAAECTEVRMEAEVSTSTSGRLLCACGVTTLTLDLDPLVQLTGDGQLQWAPSSPAAPMPRDVAEDAAAVVAAAAAESADVHALRLEMRVRLVGQLIRLVQGWGRSMFGVKLRKSDDLFRAMDRNGDGKVDAAEFRAALDRLDLGWSEDQRTRLLAVFDADGDGVIDHAEFVSVVGGVEQLLASRAARRPSLPAEVAAEVDRAVRQQKEAHDTWLSWHWPDNKMADKAQIRRTNRFLRDRALGTASPARPDRPRPGAGLAAYTTFPVDPRHVDASLRPLPFHVGLPGGKESQRPPAFARRSFGPFHRLGSSTDRPSSARLPKGVRAPGGGARPRSAPPAREAARPKSAGGTVRPKSPTGAEQPPPPPFDADAADLELIEGHGAVVQALSAADGRSNGTLPLHAMVAVLRRLHPAASVAQLEAYVADAADGCRVGGKAAPLDYVAWIKARRRRGLAKRGEKVAPAVPKSGLAMRAAGDVAQCSPRLWTARREANEAAIDRSTQALLRALNFERLAGSAERAAAAERILAYSSCRAATAQSLVRLGVPVPGVEAPVTTAAGLAAAATTVGACDGARMALVLHGAAAAALAELGLNKGVASRVDAAARIQTVLGAERKGVSEAADGGESSTPKLAVARIARMVLLQGAMDTCPEAGVLCTVGSLRLLAGLPLADPEAVPDAEAADNRVQAAHAAAVEAAAAASAAIADPIQAAASVAWDNAATLIVRAGLETTRSAGLVAAVRALGGGDDAPPEAAKVAFADSEHFEASLAACRGGEWFWDLRGMARDAVTRTVAVMVR